MWKQIQKILIKKKLNILQLSKLTGIPASTLYNYRRGFQLTFKNACKIADALNVSLEDLREH